MARIVRLTSGLLPDQALAAASRRLQHSLHQCSTSGTSVAVGSMQLTHNMQLVCPLHHHLVVSGCPTMLQFRHGYDSNSNNSYIYVFQLMTR